jgi:hypothetical protein
VPAVAGSVTSKVNVRSAADESVNGPGKTSVPAELVGSATVTPSSLALPTWNVAFAGRVSTTSSTDVEVDDVECSFTV